jgi:hypothetical protein
MNIGWESTSPYPGKKVLGLEILNPINCGNYPSITVIYDGNNPETYGCKRFDFPTNPNAVCLFHPKYPR